MWFLLAALMQQAPVIDSNDLFGWNQYAVNHIELDSLSFEYFIDGYLVGTLQNVKCDGTAPNYTCEARILNLSNGVHTLELIAFNEYGESGKSVPFRFRYSKQITTDSYK